MQIDFCPTTWVFHVWVSTYLLRVGVAEGESIGMSWSYWLKSGIGLVNFWVVLTPALASFWSSGPFGQHLGQAVGSTPGPSRITLWSSGPWLQMHAGMRRCYVGCKKGKLVAREQVSMIWFPWPSTWPSLAGASSGESTLSPSVLPPPPRQPMGYATCSSFFGGTESRLSSGSCLYCGRGHHFISSCPIRPIAQQYL